MNRTALESRLILWSCLALLALLKSYSINFSAVDENIYFYLADQVAGGALPYRDFFHADPPLHLASRSLLNWLGGGFSLLPLRLLPIGSTVGAALLLAQLEKEPPCAVVYREKHGIFAVLDFTAWLDDHYDVVFETRNKLETRRFELLRRKAASRAHAD